MRIVATGLSVMATLSEWHRSDRRSPSHMRSIDFLVPSVLGDKVELTYHFAADHSFSDDDALNHLRSKISPGIELKVVS